MLKKYQNELFYYALRFINCKNLAAIYKTTIFANKKN